jgi:hypothetical protein
MLFALLCPHTARAQAGPPFLTNDPGTPGNGHWEINVASMQTFSRGTATYQLPQIDLNFGVGDRVQLTYEIPYVVQTGPTPHSGWSNAYPGVKWRFIDQGESGWQVSTFPQFETSATAAAQRSGIAAAGSRVLLPVEAARKIGSIDLDIEAGVFLPRSGVRERILGLVVGRPVSDVLELDAELYDDHATGAPPNVITLDCGGRYRFARGVIALFMAGRSLNGTNDGKPGFMAYIGVQILAGS